MTIQPLAEIDTRSLFAPLHGELMGVLRGLSEDDWLKPTVAGHWRVRDVAAHLLDTKLRSISVLRDGHLVPPDHPIEGYAELVGFLNRLNAQWVTATERLSPAVLIDLLDRYGREAATVLAGLPPDEPAIFAVDWAGESESKNWMHVAREYTEWWHHQMQIRDAVGAPSLLDERWFQPLIDASVRALPRAYSAMEAEEGTVVAFNVTGPEGGNWLLHRRENSWHLGEGQIECASTRIRFYPDTAWRLLYNALPRNQAAQRVQIEGDAALAEPLFRTRSVMV